MIPTKLEAAAELSRRRFVNFTGELSTKFERTPFHQTYYTVLDKFAKGEIKRLIITIPPQHGKSHGSSIMLPAYILGLNPAARIAVASYNLSLASRFSRRCRQIIASKRYHSIFPDTTLPPKGAAGAAMVCTNAEFDIARHGGGLLAVGREGALTGNTVDIFILDDLYRDAMEANSPIIRGNVWEWYSSVVKTRLHNNSQELIVFTRWHEEDLIGMLEKREEVTELHSMEQLAVHQTKSNQWFKLNFEAIKRSPPTQIDPRPEGEPLWSGRHSAELLGQKRALDPLVFESLYQGSPSCVEGLLYGDNFKTYQTLPPDIVKRANYTDTADTGEDYLCSVCYSVCLEGNIYITDVVYSQESMEVTEVEVAQMLTRCKTETARIESNNGGRGFARAVAKQTENIRIEWFHQSKNKEARILSNASAIMRQVYFPKDWHQRWPRLWADLTNYRRIYRANRWHDASDTLSGVAETECDATGKKKIKALGFAQK